MVRATRTSWTGNQQAYGRPRAAYEDDDLYGRTETSPGIGQYRGRGPKGYQRSDARIIEDVCERLTEDPHVDASDIEVDVVNSEVMLTGSIKSRIVKRYVEDLVESVSGVRHVQNNLRIQPRASVLMGAGRTTGSDGNQTGGNAPIVG
jgi:osmotically-inducible protein OsmY